MGVTEWGRVHDGRMGTMQWMVLNSLLYVVVVSSWSALATWLIRRNEPYDPFDQGFLAEMLSAVFFYIMFSSLALVVYFILLHLGKIRGRMMAVAWTPLILISVWWVTGFSPENAFYLAVPAVVYGLIVRIPYRNRSQVQ